MAAPSGTIVGGAVVTVEYDLAPLKATGEAVKAHVAKVAREAKEAARIEPRFDFKEQAIRNRMAEIIRDMRQQAQRATIELEVRARLFGTDQVKTEFQAFQRQLGGGATSKPAWVMAHEAQNEQRRFQALLAATQKQVASTAATAAGTGTPSALEAIAELAGGRRGRAGYGGGMGGGRGGAHGGGLDLARTNILSGRGFERMIGHATIAAGIHEGLQLVAGLTHAARTYQNDEPYLRGFDRALGGLGSVDESGFMRGAAARMAVNAGDTEQLQALKGIPVVGPLFDFMDAIGGFSEAAKKSTERLQEAGEAMIALKASFNASAGQAIGVTAGRGSQMQFELGEFETQRRKQLDLLGKQFVEGNIDSIEYYQQVNASNRDARTRRAMARRQTFLDAIGKEQAGAALMAPGGSTAFGIDTTGGFGYMQAEFETGGVALQEAAIAAQAHAGVMGTLGHADTGTLFAARRAAITARHASANLNRRNTAAARIANAQGSGGLTQAQYEAKAEARTMAAEQSAELMALDAERVKAEEDTQDRITQVRGTGEAARLRMSRQMLAADLLELDVANQLRLSKITDAAERQAVAGAHAAQRAGAIEAATRDARVGAHGLGTRATVAGLRGRYRDREASVAGMISQLQAEIYQAPEHLREATVTAALAEARAEKQRLLPTSGGVGQVVGALELAGDPLGLRPDTQEDAAIGKRLNEFINNPTAGGPQEQAVTLLTEIRDVLERINAKPEMSIN